MSRIEPCKGRLGLRRWMGGRGTLAAIQSVHAFSQASNPSILLGKDYMGGFNRGDEALEVGDAVLESNVMD
ncbi:unnamed protein product [Prunus armeniaca]|uniref:Uncharacterized protein n=1 Tax=Prunus armeniaca TaxID=36596 RepID=A0A6J5W7J3_PRUAR|nr:unnamed protein product [Prunus armeniaca]